MKGGTRSNRRINPDSVHSLLPTYAKTIRTELEKMEPDERIEAHNETFKYFPSDESRLANITIYNDIFRDEYPEEFAKAEKAAAEAKTPEKVAAEAEAAEAKAAAFANAVKAAKAAAYATPSWETATKADFGSSIHDLLMYGPKGGKTRRNRNRKRRGRGRGRRSLKRYSKRRR